MKKAFILLVISFSSALSAQDMGLTPGMYQVTSKITVDGKNFDPSAEIKKAMAQLSQTMTPEMIAQMKKMKIEIPKIVDPNNLQICITAKDLKYEEIIKSRKESSCNYKTIKHTSQEMHMRFTCEDGSDTTSITKVLNKKHYTTNNTTKNKNDQLTKMDSEGRWISSRCTKGSINSSKTLFK